MTSKTKITDKDLEFLKEKGITKEQLEEQLQMLAEGFPFLRLDAPATIGHGISKLNHEMEERAINCWDQFLSEGGTVMKMVPASGAASRMFKDLFSFVSGKKDKPDTDFMKKFFDEIESFPFFSQLNFLCVSLYGKSVETLLKEGKYKEVAETLIEKTGLNYGHLPKALLKFHKVMGDSRTALEEHLAEGAMYAAGKKKKVRVHFTVSPDHLPLVEMKVEEAKGLLGHLFDVDYEVTYSIQKPSTDTIAANFDGTPYRENGDLFFRPGGHGALIENLNDLDADVIFIKNIDNVVPDAKRESTVKFKKILGGVLVATKQKADEYCRLLAKGTPTPAELEEMMRFTRNVLCITNDGMDEMTDDEKAAFLFRKLDRPMRVCGMVKNEGEPGGGPWLVYNPDGTISPQILEPSQINVADKDCNRMLESSTHFNPVDLACATKNYKGEKYNLPDFVDKSTGFISEKSREGVEIKALELPGLWNGAMSDWNTIFIEVPADTFNPVKTVNDLLRESHK